MQAVQHLRLPYLPRLPPGGEAMSTAWWIVVPPSEQNATSMPSDAKIISNDTGSKDYSTLLNTDAGTITVGGVKVVRYMGPFTSKADAQKAFQAGPQDASIAPGISVGPGGDFKGPLSGIGDAAHAIAALAGVFKGVADALTDGKLWRSVGWLLLGVVLIFLGVRLWYGSSLGSAAKAVPGLPGKVLGAI
jgi:hypothetical protein